MSLDTANGCGDMTFYRYWGKAFPLKEVVPSYHLLPYHCLDVAAVGKALLDNQPALLQQLANLSGINNTSFLDWITFLLAIHDVGKFADGFQNKRADLFSFLQEHKTQAPDNEHHSSLGYRFCLECVIPVFIEKGMHGYESRDDLESLLRPWLASVTGHHGRPPKLELYPPPIRTQFPNQVSEDALAFLRETIALMLPNGLPFNLDAYDRHYQIFKRISWLMAGLAVAADWIGSNQRWFHYHDRPMPLTDYWYNIALRQAKTAASECGLLAVEIAPFSGMQMLFPAISELTPLQRLAEEVEITDGPQLFIIEEVTGGGKTEAALTLAHRLMAKGEASGIFMALPTMATANAMHKRIQDMYQKLFLENSHPSFILAHSASQMVLDLERKNSVDNGYSRDESSASQDCTAWLSDSRKKALLAHVGVGTIDQALLAILAVRHQSLRLLGLSRKVLIVDEVHACDAYVHRLLCTLLEFHSSQGGNAILLSATLPQTMRTELLNSFAKGTGKKAVAAKDNAYPLLTHLSETTGVRELPVAARTSVSRRVEMQPLYCTDEINRMLQDVLNAGGCACWVRNTVYDVLQAYHKWKDRVEVMLFHARFTLGDRLKIEQEVIRCFGHESTPTDRQGKLLIATQVVEQSLDLDFDFMVSDLAPIDLLIQRAGRLQRHTRGKRKPPVLGVYMPKPIDAKKDWFKGFFPKASNVYKHHGQLWLTAKWLEEHRGFVMPDDTRNMIESVYNESSQSSIPQDLQTQEEGAEGKDRANKSLASFNSLKLHEGYQATMINWQDDLSAPTRLGEPTVTVRLARWDGAQLVPWNTENTGHNWELSQITIRKYQIAREDPDNMPEFVVTARQTMLDEGRYCVVIPMQTSGKIWTGQVLNSHDKIVTVTYDDRIGLEVNKGDTNESD